MAAIIIEPVQGEGGFVPASPAYMAGLREVCDEHGIVLIADEVQSGYGRTGTLFAMEQLGVEPDLVTIAKSMAGGMPISASSGAPRSSMPRDRRRSAARSSATPSAAPRRSRCST